MDTIKIFMGIPTINRADLLNEALADLSKVMPDLYKLVIVDNGNQSIKIPDNLKEKTEIYNPGKNLGVAASWNYILNEGFKNPEITHVQLTNDDIIPGHSLEQINSIFGPHSDNYLVLGSAFSNFFISRECFNVVGLFDEKFYPAYFEDNDYGRRCGLINKGRVAIKLTPKKSQKSSSIRKDPKLNRNFSKNRNYYIKKWGGPPNKEKYNMPFNKINPEIDFIQSYYSAFNSLFEVSKEYLLELYREDTYGGYPEEPAGSAWESELKALYCAIRLAKPKKLLEIGNFVGVSTNHMLAAIEKNGFGELHLVDVIDRLNRDKLHSNNFTHHVEESLNYLDSLQELDFDFISQDGDHSEDYVRKELQVFKNKSTKDLYIWGHDYYARIRAGVGVKQAWDKEKSEFTKVHHLKDSVSDCGFSLAFLKRK